MLPPFLPAARLARLARTLENTWNHRTLQDAPFAPVPTSTLNNSKHEANNESRWWYRPAFLPACLEHFPQISFGTLGNTYTSIQIPEPTALFIVFCWIDQQVNDNGYDNHNTSSFAEQTHKPTIKIQTKHFPFFEHQLTELKFVDNQH